MATGTMLTLDDERRECFRRHCKLYYQRSLSLVSSTSVSDDVTDVNNGATRSNDNDNGSMKMEMDGLEASQVVLDALEHQIGTIQQAARAANRGTSTSSTSSTGNHNEMEVQLSNEFKDFFESDKVKKHSDVLRSCGLYVYIYNNIHMNMQHVVGNGNGNDDDGNDNDDCETGGRNTANSCTLQQDILIEYTKVKDEERRVAHVMKMKERKQMLFNLLYKHILKQQQQQQQQSQHSQQQQPPQNQQEEKENNTTTNNNIYIGEYNVTTQKYLTHTRSKINTFVNQYKQNIGTHSLLAGIKQIIHKQIDAGRQLCYWRLNCSVISESCFSGGVALRTSNSTSTGGGEQYMMDALSLLLSFMVYDSPIGYDYDYNYDTTNDIEATNGNGNGNMNVNVNMNVNPTTTNGSKTASMCTGTVVLVEEEEEKSNSTKYRYEYSQQQQKQQQQQTQQRLHQRLQQQHDDNDEFITFYIHPAISDSFLKYIMADIPSNLDARPTGTTFTTTSLSSCSTTSSSSSNENKNNSNRNDPNDQTQSLLVRTNQAGHFDESSYLHLLQWSSDSFCEIL